MLDKNISKILFLFISYIIVSSNYLTQVLPCQTQFFLKSNIYGKHIIGYLISFIFIMLVGGWSFNQKEEDMAEVDWHNGNVLDTLVYALLLYVIFVLSSKMKLVPNLILYGILFFCYCLNTQKEYWKNRNIIEEDTEKKIEDTIKTLFGICILILFYGIIDYYKYQKSKYKKQFSNYLFFLGDSKCKSLYTDKDGLTISESKFETKKAYSRFND